MFQEIVSAPATLSPLAGLEDWWGAHEKLRRDADSPFAAAVIAGFRADRLGYAFASGYVEAVHQLLGERAGSRTALCASEEGGARPSAIATLLAPDGNGFRLGGDKKWTTLGTFADSLLVIASRGRQASGRNELAAVLVPANRDGVTLTEMPPIPFVPEIPHATLSLRDVRVEASDVLEGDAYLRVLKPFRTVEDLFVHGALCGWLVQVARRSGWPIAVVEQLLAVIAGLAALVDRPPLAPATHLALAGLIDLATAIVNGTDEHWSSVDEETRSRWQRDRPLLQIAHKAREARRETARAALGAAVV